MVAVNGRTRMHARMHAHCRTQILIHAGARTHMHAGTLVAKIEERELLMTTLRQEARPSAYGVVIARL